MIITIVMLIVSLMLLSSIGANEKITISNLVDDTSREILKQQLLESLPEQNINQFLQQVTYYNQVVNHKTMVQNGEEAFSDYKRNYQTGEITQAWMEEEPIFPGTNCRITTYTLLKDTITFDKRVEPKTHLLFIDQVAFESAEKDFYQFDSKEIQDFEVIFSAVPTELGKDKETYVKVIKNYYQNQTMQFNLDDVSMITVWFLDDLEEEASLFVGHVGVLVKDESDYLFIEKISFEEPYQVLRFKTKEQLHQYLMATYESQTEGTIKPIIFENDQWMDNI